ncbi:hypothetical protein PAMA_017864 [Pampus argenteus]
MAEAAGSSDQHERSCSHIPTFSARHPMIPKLYVMPWKQDMKNQRLLIKVEKENKRTSVLSVMLSSILCVCVFQNAALAGVPAPPHEESLCFCGRERLCHSQDSNHCSTSPSSSSSVSAPLSQTGVTAHHSSHFSRYNSSVVTTRRLYQT